MEENTYTNEKLRNNQENYPFNEITPDWMELQFDDNF